MLLTNKYLYIQDSIKIYIYEYFGCLYSASVLTEHGFYRTPLYVLLQEAIVDVVNYNAKVYA